MPYKLSTAAADDVVSIFVYTIENFGRDQADRYRDGLTHTFELIGETPLMGRQHRGQVRRFLFGRHVIFYEVKPDHVLILRVRHSAVDSE